MKQSIVIGHSSIVKKESCHWSYIIRKVTGEFQFFTIDWFLLVNGEYRVTINE